MLKLVLFFLLFSTYVFGVERVEIYATKMDSKENTVYAHGEVNVIYKDYFISAEEAKYDRKSGDLELFKNIRITQGKSYKIIGAYARMNIKDKTREFKPFYMLEKQSNTWISGKKSVAINKDLDVESGMLSGCDPIDPLWKMQFSSSTYDQNSKWLNLYNTRLYIYDIPVFYTPYFGYSMDNKRQTGLLLPSFGVSSDEGFYYEQPLYIALDDWWDIEFKPQLRTLRGKGIYSTFRFVDSKISKGALTIGQFEEKDSYYNEHNLANKQHFGFDFNYDNRSFLNQWFGTSFDGQSAMFADIHYLNDVDYLNLSTNDTTTSSTATQVLSRVNLFYNNESNYFGSYFKYYQDLTLENNKNTLQKLPTLHYHSYLDSVLNKHLLYNIDLQSTNIYRSKGVGVIQSDLNIPLTLQTPLFEEYLNIAYKGFIYGQATSFNHEENDGLEYNDSYYARNYNVIQASTQVSKAFEDFTHTMGFRTSYTFSGTKTSNGFYEDEKDYCSDISNRSDTDYEARCEFYNVSDINEAINISFTQYLFDSSGVQKLYHKLSQNIVYQDDSKSLGDLENELEYKFDSSISYYNNMFFNYDESLFSKVYNSISYNGYGMGLAFSHVFQDNFDHTKTGFARFSSYLTSSFRYIHDEHYSYNAVLNYDLEKTTKKTASIGFLYKKRCWDFGISYVENNRPVLTNSGDAYNSIYDRYIYFTILLKPLMKASSVMNSAFTYKLPELYNGE